MKNKKTIAMIAHDNKKQDIVEWAEFNSNILIEHNIICTGTTGSLIELALKSKIGNLAKAKQLNITKLKSGPLGGDQQMGALIAENKIDYIIFLCDPMEPQPHDVDVKALLRIANVYNIPIATNRSTADFIISSPLFNSDYKAIADDFSAYLNRMLGK
jgi:methylglyoxal synthase